MVVQAPMHTIPVSLLELQGIHDKQSVTATAAAAPVALRSPAHQRPAFINGGLESKIACPHAAPVGR